jgi:hypothetical protein
MNNDFLSSEIHQVSKTLFESQQATDKQMVRLLYMHREELSKQIEQFENGLKSNLESYEAALETVLKHYDQKRKELYHQAVVQLAIIHNCQTPDILKSENQANGVTAHHE